MEITAHANLDSNDDDGWTPLSRAAENGDSEVAQLLLAAHADGQTPLSWAAKNCHSRVVRLFFGCAYIQALLVRHSSDIPNLGVMPNE